MRRGGNPLTASFASMQATGAGESPRPETFPSQDPGRVREMVSVSHGNLARVLEAHPVSPRIARLPSAGAPQVRIRFAAGERAESVTIEDGAVTVTARR